MLRGPQGTLYGRNTIGGAIKYVTRRLPADPQLNIRGTLGTYQQADLVVTASTPVTEDRRLRIGGSVARLSRGGFGDNLTTGLENYNKDVWAGRLSAEYNNGGTAFVRLQGDYTADDSNPRGGHRLIPGIASGAPVLADVFDSQGALLDPHQQVRAWGMSLYAEVQPWDNWTLRSITAYRRDDTPRRSISTPCPRSTSTCPGSTTTGRPRRSCKSSTTTAGSTPWSAPIISTPIPRRSSTSGFRAELTALTFGNVGTETYALFGDFTYDFIADVQRLGRRPLHLGPAHVEHRAHRLSRRRRLALLRRHRRPDRAAVELHRHRRLPASSPRAPR